MNVASGLIALTVAGLLASAAANAQGHEHHAAPEHAGHGGPAEQPGHAEHQQHGPEHTSQPTSSEPTQSELEHVPPLPPELEVHDMPYKAMTKMMEMDDTASYGKVLFDQLDWRDADDASVFAWDAQAWYGTDYNKAWLKTEGERTEGTTEEARVELLWDRIFSRWFSLQAGVRHDFGDGPSRDWLAVGVEGLAPYFFELEATAYFGDDGRTAARISAEYDLLITQRLILQPEIELSAYGKADPENRIGSGLSDAEISLRLRYEIRREIAPYVGVTWIRHMGNTADLVRSSGKDDNDLQVLAGIRFWF